MRSTAKGKKRSAPPAFVSDVDFEDEEFGNDIDVLDKLTRLAFGESTEGDSEATIDSACDDADNNRPVLEEFREQQADEQSEFNVYISPQFVGVYDKTVIRVRNHVVQARLNTQIDWRVIVPRCTHYGMKYATRNFGAIDMACINPKATMRAYSSGMISCSGAQNIGHAIDSIEKMIEIFQSLCDHRGNAFYPTLKCTSIKLVNLVGDIDLGYSIDLNRLKMHHFVKYEPDEWPTAYIRLRDLDAERYHERKVVALVSSEGSIVITGAISKTDLVDVYRSILPVLESCARYDPTTLKPLLSRQTTEDAQRRVEIKRRNAVVDATLKLCHICPVGSLALVAATKERHAMAVEPYREKMQDSSAIVARNMIALHSIDQIEVQKAEAEQEKEEDRERGFKVHRVKELSEREARILASLIPDND